MKRLVTVTAAVLVVPLLAASAHAGKRGAGAARPDESAKVSIARTPDVLKPRGTSVTVAVTYSCSNTARTTHYLSGNVTQPDTPRYVIGYRGDLGGTVRATCTGKAVKQRLTFQRSAYWEYHEHPTLQPGQAQLVFNVEARGTFGSGAGWYDIVGPGAAVDKTVTIRAVR